MNSNPSNNIGKIENTKCSQIYTYLTWYKDGHGGKLPLKYFCLKCYSLWEMSKTISFDLTSPKPDYTATKFSIGEHNYSRMARAMPRS